MHTSRLLVADRGQQRHHTTTTPAPPPPLRGTAPPASQHPRLAPPADGMMTFAQLAPLAVLLLAQAAVGPSLPPPTAEVPAPPKIPGKPSAEALAALRDKLKGLTPESMVPPDMANGFGRVRTRSPPSRASLCLLAPRLALTASPVLARRAAEGDPPGPDEAQGVEPPEPRRHEGANLVPQE